VSGSSRQLVMSRVQRLRITDTPSSRLYLPLLGVGSPDRLVDLVAQHSCVTSEAELRGLSGELAEFEGELAELRRPDRTLLIRSVGTCVVRVISSASASMLPFTGVVADYCRLFSLIWWGLEAGIGISDGNDEHDHVLLCGLRRGVRVGGRSTVRQLCRQAPGAACDVHRGRLGSELAHVRTRSLPWMHG
jgi:hypothetical protein